MSTILEVPGTEKSEKEILGALNRKLVICIEVPTNKRGKKKGGKKIITIVKGFNNFKPEDTSDKDYTNNIKDFMKFIKNKKGCAGAFMKDDNNKTTTNVMFQGNCVDLCYEYVLKHKMVPKDKIEKKGL